VAGLAIASAEKDLEASIDEDANRALIDKLASQL
jgi:F0F1-type ATP synthase membrane subunit b/b'